MKQMPPAWVEVTFKAIYDYYTHLSHDAALQQIANPHSGLIAATRYCLGTPDESGEALLTSIIKLAQKLQTENPWCTGVGGTMPVIGILETGLGIIATRRANIQTNIEICVGHFARAIWCFDPHTEEAAFEWANICTTVLRGNTSDCFPGGNHALNALPFCQKALAEHLKYSPKIGTVHAMVAELHGEEICYDQEVSLPWLNWDTYTGELRWSLDRLHIRLVADGTGEIVRRPGEMAFACLTDSVLEDIDAVYKEFASRIPQDKNLLLWLESPSIVSPLQSCGYGVLYIGLEMLLCEPGTATTGKELALQTLVLLVRDGQENPLFGSKRLIYAALKSDLWQKRNECQTDKSRHFVLPAAFKMQVQAEGVQLSFASQLPEAVDLVEQNEPLLIDPMQRLLRGILRKLRNHSWVTIYGEPGVGKSLIVSELQKQLSSIEVRTIDCVRQGIHDRSTLIDAMCVAMKLKLIRTARGTGTVEKLEGQYPPKFLLILDGLTDSLEIDQQKEQQEIGKFLADWSWDLGADQRLLVTAVTPLNHPFEATFPLLPLVTPGEKRSFLQRNLKLALTPEMDAQMDLLAQKISGSWNALEESHQRLKAGQTPQRELERVEGITTPDVGKRRYDELSAASSLPLIDTIHYLALLPAGADRTLLERLFFGQTRAIIDRLDRADVLKPLSKHPADETPPPTRHRLEPEPAPDDRICLKSAIADYALRKLQDTPAHKFEIETVLESYYQQLLEPTRTPNDIYPNKNLLSTEDLVNIEAAMRRIEERCQSSDNPRRADDAVTIVAFALKTAPHYWWDGRSRGQTVLESALRAVEFLPPAMRMSTRAECHYHLGQLFRRWAKYRSARRDFTYARLYFTRAGDLFGAARALVGMAGCFQQQDELEDALKTYREAQSTIQKDRQRVQASLAPVDSNDQAFSTDSLSTDSLHEFFLAFIRQKLGEVYCKMGNFERARVRLQESIEGFELLHNSLQLGSSYRLLGKVAQMCGDYKQAVFCYDAAKSHYDNANADIGRAHLLAARGEIYWWQDRHQEALRAFIAAREKYKEKIDTLGFFRTSVLQAQTLRVDADRLVQTDPVSAIKQYDEAYQLLYEAEELGRDIWVPGLIADCVRAKADIHRKKANCAKPTDIGELDQAIALYDMAYIIQKKRKIRFGAARALLNKGQTLYLMACALMKIEPYLLADAPGVRLRTTETGRSSCWHESLDGEKWPIYPRELLENAYEEIYKAWKRCQKMGARHLEAHCVVELIYIGQVLNKQNTVDKRDLDEAIRFYRSSKDFVALKKAEVLISVYTSQYASEYSSEESYANSSPDESQEPEIEF